jgi:4-carboxymuconolactone decarboxylase
MLIRSAHQWRFTMWLLAQSLLLVSLTSVAQDRMPLIPERDLTTAQADAVTELRTVRGIELRGPWIPLLRSPELMRRSRAMGDYLRFNSALPPRLSEFIILMTARDWTQQYEWYAHRDIAIEAGLSEEIVTAIAEGRRPNAMAEDEALLYSMHTELSRNKSISDDTYEQAVSHFGERGVVDFVGIVGYYSLLAMVMNTARTPLPNNSEPSLGPIPP